MNRYLLGCLRHASLLGGLVACALFSTPSAYSASFTSSVTTATNTYLGGPGFFLPYTASNSSPAVSTTSLTALTLGSFTSYPAADAPNGNVTSTFTINTNLSGVTSPITFTGSVVADTKYAGEYDVTFSSPTTYYWAAAPHGAATFDVENVGTCNVSQSGCYTIGIEPIIGLASGKATSLYAFIGPSNLTTPEPSTFATMGLASMGLLMFALRRKLQGQRS